MTEENVVVEEAVEEATEETDTPTETEEAESTEQPQEEAPFDWNSLELKHLDDIKHLSDYQPDEVKGLFQKGMDYDRKISKYEERLNSAHYKWVDDYMKANNYSDPVDFVKAIKVNEKKSALMAKGLSEEDALAEATEYVDNTFGNQTDHKTKELEKFLDWHQNGVEKGRFGDKLDINSIPEEVVKAYENGESLKEAFLDYYVKDLKVKTEQDTLKKLTKNKETSTGELKPSPSNDATLTPEQIESKLSTMNSKEKSAWIKKNMKAIEKSGYFN